MKIVERLHEVPSLTKNRFRWAMIYAEHVNCLQEANKYHEVPRWRVVTKFFKRQKQKSHAPYRSGFFFSSLRTEYKIVRNLDSDHR